MINLRGFSRYERGETPIPKPLSQLLQLLQAHPDLLVELSRNTAKIKLQKSNIAKMIAAN